MAGPNQLQHRAGRNAAPVVARESVSPVARLHQPGQGVGRGADAPEPAVGEALPGQLREQPRHAPEGPALMHRGVESAQCADRPDDEPPRRIQPERGEDLRRVPGALAPRQDRGAQVGGQRIGREVEIGQDGERLVVIAAVDGEREVGGVVTANVLDDRLHRARRGQGR